MFPPLYPSTWTKAFTRLKLHTETIQLYSIGNLNQVCDIDIIYMYIWYMNLYDIMIYALYFPWLFFRSPASNIPATGPSTLTLKVDVVGVGPEAEADAVVGVGRMGGAQMPSHWVASVCDGWGDEAARLVETGVCCWRVPETLKLTFLHFLPLKLSAFYLPKGNEKVFLLAATFRGENVSFREGRCF